MRVRVARPLRSLVGWVCIPLVWGMGPSPAFADGFRNPFQGSAAIGQGNAFAAQADDPTAVFYNPAAMTRLPGIQHAVGVQFVSPHTRFTSPSGARTANDLGGPVGWPPPGQLFFTANLERSGLPVLRDLSLGLGLLSLYGFGNKYPESAPFSSTSYQGSLPLLDIKPTLAYKVSDHLSLGLGADIFTFASFVGEGQTESLSISSGAGGIPAGSRVELNGKGTTAGLNASVLYTLIGTADRPRVNLAGVWRSQAVLPVRGRLLVNGVPVADASTNVLLSEVWTLGLAGWLLRDVERAWKVEVDVDYTRWRSVRNFDVALSTGAAISNPQHWNNSVSIAVGTEYKWLHLPEHAAWQLALRVGYNRSHTPIPDVNYNPVIPDADVHVWSVGVGLFCQEGGQFWGLVDCGGAGGGWLTRKAIGLDLAYQLLLFEPRTVTGHANPGVNGTYRTTTNAGSLTLRINF